MDFSPTVDGLRSRKPENGASVGILLVGHGTRSVLGRQEFLELAASVAMRAAPIAVEPAYLELAEPTIGQGILRLVERGARQVVVVPLLLFSAGHAKDDIPAAVQAAAEGQGIPKQSVHQTEHLGCEKHILELSTRRFTAALQGRSPVPVAKTCLLLVGRGSRDVSATSEMHEFVRLRSAAASAAHCEVAFLALAQPSLNDILPDLAAQDWRRIVVQPHLLFHGELLDGLHRQVSTIAAGHPTQEWIVTAHLGEGPVSGPAGTLLAEAVLGRVQAAGIRVVAPGGDG